MRAAATLRCGRLLEKNEGDVATSCLPPPHVSAGVPGTVRKENPGDAPQVAPGKTKNGTLGEVHGTETPPLNNARLRLRPRPHNGGRCRRRRRWIAALHRRGQGHSQPGRGSGSPRLLGPALAVEASRLKLLHHLLHQRPFQRLFQKLSRRLTQNRPKAVEASRLKQLTQPWLTAVETSRLKLLRPRQQYLHRKELLVRAPLNGVVSIMLRRYPRTSTRTTPWKKSMTTSVRSRRTYVPRKGT